jgi:succinate dehydrogenase/fumarate reductase-like Fe-S protein
MHMASLTLRVTRGSPEQGSSQVEYVVPWSDGLCLLEALFWVREHLDPSLSVRFSCRSANACKECLAQVDGRPVYLCVTRAQPGSVVHIEPLPRRPWLRDLVTQLEADG